jgi:hypothetical protein
MRYFRRGGPDVLIFESTESQRFVTGPVFATEENPEGVPGGTVAYDEEDETLGKRMCAQLEADTSWYEVDGRGDPLPPPAPVSDTAASDTGTTAPSPPAPPGGSAADPPPPPPPADNAGAGTTDEPKETA